MKQLAGDCERLSKDILAITERLTSLTTATGKTSTDLCKLFSDVNTKSRETQKSIEAKTKQLNELASRTGTSESRAQEQSKQLAVIEADVKNVQKWITELNNSIKAVTKEIGNEALTINTQRREEFVGYGEESWCCN